MTACVVCGARFADGGRGRPRKTCNACRAKFRRVRRAEDVAKAREWSVRLRLRGGCLCPEITGDECMEVAEILGRLT